MKKPPSSIFYVEISEEYRPCLDDMVRMVTIQIMVNLLLYYTDPGRYPFFGEQFLATLLYIIVGIMLYWLVIRKIIRFQNTEDREDIKNTGFYYGSA